MASYKGFFKQSVEKDLRSIPRDDLSRIMRRIGALRQEPRPPGCEKLAGQERYRLRQGAYRSLYSVHDDELTVWVVKVGHRKDIYR